MVVNVLTHSPNSGLPSRSSIACVRRTAYSVLPRKRLVAPSFTCQIATVRPKISSKRSVPGTSDVPLAKTWNEPPSPVVIVTSSISSLKKAVTGDCVETPIMLASGSTVAVGMPAGAPSSGGNWPTRHPLLPTSTCSWMFWSATARQEPIRPETVERSVNVWLTLCPTSTCPSARVTGPSISAQSGSPVSSSVVHSTISASAPVSRSRLAYSAGVSPVFVMSIFRS